MQKQIMSAFLVAILVLICSASADSQQQAQPDAATDAKTLLDKANETMNQTQSMAKITEAKADAAVTKAEAIGKAAEASIQQAKSMDESIHQWVWFFGIAFGLVSLALGLYGFNTQKGFNETLGEYKTALNAYQMKLEKINELQEVMTGKVQEVEAIRQELSNLKESVKKEFENTNQAMVLLNLGNKLFETGKTQQAIEVYVESNHLLPYDPEVNYRLGRAYSNTSNYDDAIQAFQKALDARPNFPEANMELGLAYRRHADTLAVEDQRKAEYRLAEHYLKRAIDLRPTYDDALATLGGLYRREKNYAASLQCYLRAANANPDSSYALNNVASLSWHAGQLDLARDYFKRVEQLASMRILHGGEDALWALHDKALALLAQGRIDEALAEHKAALEKTVEKENLRSVLSNLKFLAEKPMERLDEFIKLIEAKLG